MILNLKVNLPLVFLLITSFLSGQVPFEHIIIDENGPSSPWGKATGDLNNDGYPDLIIGGWQGGLVWYEYPGWEKHAISEDRIETDIEVADIDNDGMNDIVAIGIENLNWYKGSGWERHAIYPAVRVHDLEVADLNGDGKPDITARNQKYSANSGDTIHLFIQGSTTDKWDYYTITCQQGEGLKIYDINKDNKPDLIIGGFWFENTEDMSNWISHRYTSSWNYPHTYLATGDINGDGLTDLILAPAEEAGDFHKIAWYEQPDDVYGDWNEHVIIEEIETTCHFTGAADFNNDNKIDVAVAQMQQSTDPDEVFIMLNHDTGETWTKQVLATTGSHSMKITDIGMDGDFDLFGANWSNNTKIELWVNRSDSIPKSGNVLNNWSRHVIDNNKDWTSLFIDGKDLNGDGLPEIITGGWWYTNPGIAGGEWVKNNIGPPLNNMACVYDFDGDGDYDILGTMGEGATANSDFAWARNDGNANFTIFSNIERAEGDFLQGAAIVRNENESPYHVALSWHAAGKGVQTFTIPPNPSTEIWKWEKISEISQDECLSSGDIDLDGNTDLLMGTRWLQNNDGIWNLNTIIQLDDTPDRNKLKDLNNDGLPDAIIGYEAISTEGKLAWYEQPDSQSEEWNENIVAYITGPMSLDAADMDNDGDIDLIVGEHNLTHPDSANMFVFENLTGDADKWVRHLVYQGDEHHDGAVTVDIDNDGDLDILSIGWGHKKILLYENRNKIATPSNVKTVADDLNQLIVYPNPAKEKIVVELKAKFGESVYIKIFNGNGKLICQSSEKNLSNYYQSIIPVQNWNPGIYIIQIQTGNGIFTRKNLILK